MATKKFYFETEETVTTKRKGWIEIEEEFTQVYDCILAVSPKLKMGVSYQLLLWLSANMNPMNGIQVGGKTYENFNKHLTADCDHCAISRSTFNRGIEELRMCGVLTKVAKAFYYINPHFLWRGTKKARIEFLNDEKKDDGVISFNPAKDKIQEEI